MKLKLRFLAGGTVIFLLGFTLSAVRRFGLAYGGLMVVGIALLVLGLFWKDKPPSQPVAHNAAQ